MAHPSLLPRTLPLWCGLVGLVGWLPAQATVTTFGFTGAADSCTAPAGVESISITAMGAQVEGGSLMRLSGLSGLGDGFSLASGVDRQLLAVNKTCPLTSLDFGFDATTLATGLYIGDITLSTKAGAA